MGSAEKLLSVEDDLAGELVSPVKHEYLGGVVYAMAGARNFHNLITGNVFGALHARLRGSGCRPYNSNTKIRIRLSTQVRFYYPDASVIRRPNPLTDSFQDDPTVIVEVLAQKTRRLDEGEKSEKRTLPFPLKSPICWWNRKPTAWWSSAAPNRILCGQFTAA